MKQIIAVFILSILFVSCLQKKEDTIMVQKEECEKLLNDILPFAIECLEKYGEFFPFGTVMKNDKSINPTAYYDGDEKPESKEVINNLENIYKKLAENNEIIASIIVYDAKINIDNQNEDAIIVSLEHKDNYSVILAFPYKIKNKSSKNEVNLYEAIAFEGSKNIF